MKFLLQNLRDNVVPIIWLIVPVLILTFSIFGTSNLDYVKQHSQEKWKAEGFDTVNYQGYEWGFRFILLPKYGGARVWYRLKKIPDNGITYAGYIQRWGDELHVYGPTACDAIKP